MKRILVSLHAALGVTVLLPVYKPNFDQDQRLGFPWRDYSRSSWTDCLPLEEAAEVFLHRRYALLSIAAAGLPAFLASLNLPILLRFRGEVGTRWTAFSSLVLGLLSASVLSQLLVRYGHYGDWGAWVIWGLSLLLMVAGTAAVARLKPAAPPLSVIRDS